MLGSFIYNDDLGQYKFNRIMIDPTIKPYFLIYFDNKCMVTDGEKYTMLQQSVYHPLFLIHETQICIISKSQVHEAINSYIKENSINASP